MASDRIAAIKTASNWQSEFLRIVAGVRTTSHFDTAARPLVISLPDSLPSPPSATREMLFLEGVNAEIATVPNRRFVLAATGTYRLDTESVTIKTGSLRPSAEYLVAESEPGIPFAILAGRVVLHRGAPLGARPNPDDEGTPVDNAWVASPHSPVVAMSNQDGSFSLPLPAARASIVTAVRSDIGSALHAQGTPGATNVVVTAQDGAPFLLAFSEPFHAALHGEQPTAISLRDEQRPETPTAGFPPAREPGTDAVVMHHDPDQRTSAMQADLGCSGYDAKGVELPLEFNARRYDDQALKAWRARGDVRISGEAAPDLIQDPKTLGPNHLDRTMGYCLLTTTDASYQAARASTGREAPWLKPGSGTSEIFQPVTVPLQAKSLQLRISVLADASSQALDAELEDDGIAARFDEVLRWVVAAPVTALPLVSRDPILIGDASTSYGRVLTPRIACADLDQTLLGRTLTLRVSVFSGPKRGAKTALVIDSAQFSKKRCTDLTGRITEERVLGTTLNADVR